MKAGKLTVLSAQIILLITYIAAVFIGVDKSVGSWFWIALVCGLVSSSPHIVLFALLFKKFSVPLMAAAIAATLASCAQMPALFSPTSSGLVFIGAPVIVFIVSIFTYGLSQLLIQANKPIIPKTPDDK